MLKSLTYSFSRFFWSIYFVLTIGVIGLFFGYILTFALYVLAFLFQPLPSVSDRIRHLAENIQCLSIRALLKIQPWNRCQTNFQPILGFYEQFNTRKILFIANHRSNLDTFLLISYIPGLRGLAKSSLFQNIFFAPFMIVAGFIPVDKGSPGSLVRGLKAMKEKILDKNRAVLIFPETTRCEKGAKSMNKFAAAFFALAIDAGALIVPIAIENTDAVMGRGDFLIHPFQNVRITMLPPIDAKIFTDAMGLRDLAWAQVKAALA
ncbi:MAG: 1-acyl-sn-glycerol-3-phosphate acyltransferase [Proteobacteria bacterium]|nr:MAG: 1-acyl-sn-glycerol-3-phosphate acyltransferase [Pseudomonadota bacterium]